MNTSKQVNAMIGFLFLAFLAFGAYYAWEPIRSADATEEQEETFATRGATLYVNNCRNCHGLVGLGPEEGGFGPQLNTTSFLILDEDNPYGAPATPIGEVDQIEEFLFTTIACGRANTFMPTWSQEHGGPLQDIQIRYLVSLITQGRWDLVEEIGHEHDEELGVNPEEVVVSDPSALSVTQNNCGQYSQDAVRSIRQRDPFAAPGEAPPPAATEPPATGGEEPIEGAVPVQMGEFYVEDGDSAPAGEVGFTVTNEGAILHNFRAIQTDLPPDGLPVSGGVVDESQVDVRVRIEDIGPGQTQSASGDLAAGSYVLICNIPGHYQLGMFMPFTVE